MQKINIEPHDAVAVLRLNNGVTNAIGPQLVADLTDAVLQIKNQYKGMLLAGGDKFFSIGLDLPELLQLDRAKMLEFYTHFNRAVLDLYTLPMPTASAIAGHATAGGAILALSCDFRYAAAGRRLIGLNEVKIGVPVPYLADLILRQIVGDRCATEMMFSGEFFEPQQAQKTGLVDAVFSAEDLEKEAVAKITALGDLPPQGLAQIKNNRVAQVRSRYDKLRQTETDSFLKCWFNPLVQELLRAAAHKF